ncbi:MAG: ROK family protein [Acidobacteriota bacterium]|nr:ROK family protein [Acidobacteriota bacterium]
MSEQAGNLVGVEVSNQILRAVCLNPAGEAVDLQEAAIDRLQGVTPQLISFINQIKPRFGDFGGRIGVALSGLIDRRTNRVALSRHTPEYVAVDIAAEVRRATGLEVILENDANAGAYGEFALGAGRGTHNIFYVLLGTGIGGAFIIEGKLWRGASGFAGEFGHLLVDSEEDLRLEDVANSANILRRIKHRVHQDSTSSLVRIREDQLSIGDLVEAANRGDGFTQMMLERTGRYVGTAIASVINLLNIEKIVVGGEIMGASEPILEGIRQNARELSFQPSFETTEIVAGQLGNRATATGAALLLNSRSQ